MPIDVLKQGFRYYDSFIINLKPGDPIFAYIIEHLADLQCEK